MIKRKTGFVLFLVIVLCVSVFVGCGSDTADKGQDNVVAETPYGKYVGLTRDSNVVSFLGVPYAKQPVGDLRWKTAQKLDESDEVFKAYDFGKTAYQPIDEFERASFAEQGEDCLSLNVWTKDINEKKPTMVFIHGGAGVSGGTTDPLYHGEKFVENNDVVVVSINYRLGVFGSLNLEEIGGEEFKGSANASAMDPVVALEWINENIESFGGDPDNITLFGESAGGSMIMRLMASPASEGLFHKAIIQSGGPAGLKGVGTTEDSVVDQTLKVADTFLKVSGKKTAQELQELSAVEVQKYAEETEEALGDTLSVGTWSSVPDDYAIAKNPFQNIKDGAGKDVQVLIGTNQDEINYFKLYDPDLEKSLEEEYKDGTTLGKDFAINTKSNIEAADKYIASQKDNPQKYTDFCGEYWLKQPSILFAELQSKYNDVYMYNWVWDSNVEGLGACHAVELAFVLGNFDSAEAIAYSGENLPEDLARRTQASWAAFAATGNPSIEEEVEWPKYNADKRTTMIIDLEPWKTEDNPNPDGLKYMRNMYQLVTPTN